MAEQSPPEARTVSNGPLIDWGFRGAGPSGIAPFWTFWNIMAKISPLEFIQQVGAETGKVVWPTRRETGITTLMVVIFAFVASVFFFVVDFILRTGLSSLMSFVSSLGR